MKIPLSIFYFPCFEYFPICTYFSTWFLGFRMAAECARNALLVKVVDNKDDSGIFFSHSFVGFVFRVL